MKGIYILYKTVRIETGEYYIGIHGIDTDKFPRFNDPYLGSGDRIEASVKKHGKKAFKRSILAIRESSKEVLALEAAMVTVEMIADPLCLNIALGGRAGVTGVTSPLKGVPTGPKSPEHRQAISDALKGIPRSAETRQAIRDAMKGVLSPLKGVPKSAEHRLKMSDAKKGVPKSPEHRQAMSDAQRERRRQQKLANASKDLSDFIG